MIFLAKHLNPDFLLKYFKSIEEIIDILTIIIDKNGLSIQTMDNSHISVIDSFIDKEEFSSYNYTANNKTIIIGVNLKQLCKILSVTDKLDTVLLSLDKGLDKLTLIFENIYRKSEFIMRLIDTDLDTLDIPSLDYEQEIDISFNRFNRLCQEINIVKSKNIKFDVNADDKTINIYGDGDFGYIKTTLKENLTTNNKKFIVKKQNGKIVLNKKTEDYTVYSFRNTFTIEFSLTKIESILKIGSLCNQLLINLSENSPMKLEFNISDNSYLHYYIAPKIVDY